jgi:hypothetical protein
VKVLVNLLANLLASAIGGAIGTFTAFQILEEKTEEHISQIANDSLGYPQGDMALYMGNITATEEGKTNAVLLLNCVLLRGKIAHIHPDLEANLERREELEKLRENAKEIVAKLTEKGLCNL